MEKNWAQYIFLRRRTSITLLGGNGVGSLKILLDLILVHVKDTDRILDVNVSESTGAGISVAQLIVGKINT